MKRTIPILLIMLFLTCPVASPASYLIQLKNGTEFKTHRYWEGSDQIMFYLYGGIVGVQKDSVKDIKESHLQYREKAVDQSTAAQKPQEISIQTETKAQTAFTTAESKEDFKQLMEAFHLLKERFKSATSMTTLELYKFSNDLTDFKKNPLAKEFSHIYNEQLIEIYSMGDAVEAILKARSH